MPHPNATADQAEADDLDILIYALAQRAKGAGWDDVANALGEARAALHSKMHPDDQRTADQAQDRARKVLP